ADLGQDVLGPLRRAAATRLGRRGAGASRTVLSDSEGQAARRTRTLHRSRRGPVAPAGTAEPGRLAVPRPPAATPVAGSAVRPGRRLRGSDGSAVGGVGAGSRRRAGWDRRQGLRVTG